MYGNVITKIKYIETVDYGKRTHAVNHLEYIGTRTGTDYTVTEQSALRDEENEKLIKSHSSKYLDYMGNRTGVIVDANNEHGLFDAHGTPDINVIRREIDTLRHTPVYTMIVSIKEDTAQHLDFTSKEDWELFARANMPYVAEQMGISLNNLNWVAAMHEKEDHPHAHFLIWDKSDEPRIQGWKTIPDNNLVKIRQINAKGIYKGRHDEIAFNKTEYRNYILDTLKGDSDEIIKFIKKIQDVDLRTLEKLIGDDNLDQTTKDMVEIINILPIKGRINYAFLPPDKKAVVDRVVDNIIKTEKFNDAYNGYLYEHEKLAGKYATSDDVLNDKRSNADEEIRTRMANVLLKHAKEYAIDISNKINFENAEGEYVRKFSEDNIEHSHLKDKKYINNKPIKEFDVDEWETILNNRSACIEAFINNSMKNSKDSEHKGYILRIYVKYNVLTGLSFEEATKKAEQLNDVFNIPLSSEEFKLNMQKANYSVSFDNVYLRTKTQFLNKMKTNPYNISDAKIVIENEKDKNSGQSHDEYIHHGANQKVLSVAPCILRALRDISSSLNDKRRGHDTDLNNDRYSRYRKRQAEHNRGI